MVYAIVLLLFGVVITGLIGLFVYLRDPGRAVNRTWGAMCASVSWWYFGRYMRLTSFNEGDALFWCRLMYMGAVFAPSLFVHFVYSLIGIQKKKLVIFLYSMSFIFFVSNFTHLFIKSISLKISIYYPVPGVLYPLYLIFFLVCLNIGFFELIKAYRRAVGYRRNQLKYMFFASIIGFLSALSTFPLVYNIEVPPVGAPFVSAYTLIVAYAIVKYRLMDINLVIKKGVLYSFFLLLLLIPCVVLIMFAQRYFFGSIDYSFSCIVLILLAITTFIFPQLKTGTERTLEQVLFKGKYDYRKTLNHLSKAMIAILDKETVLTKFIDTTTKGMGVKKASILLFDEEKGAYCVQTSRGLTKIVSIELTLDKNDPFINWLKGKGEIVVTEELERYHSSQGIQEIIERLRSMESEICIPLITTHGLIGICNLGKKRSGDMFSHEDLNLLETLSNHAAIAIENAKLYEDLKKSESQVRRADRLAALGTLTAGLAHEIRNPLVAIKTFTQLLPDRLDDIEFREHFLKVTAGEVDRLSSLVNELLSFARPSEPNLQMENINDVAEKMILLVNTEAKKKNLTINTRYSNEVNNTMIDKEQIKQVLLNLFLNAIQASPENGTITFETRHVRKNSSPDYVQMEIRDVGNGIPEDDLEHIFTPFFTTKHEGNGLGLSICHKIIEEHSGYIEVESKEGEGTTFYVNFPMNPMRDVLSVNREEESRGV